MGLRRWYDENILPRLMLGVCGQQAIAARRAAIVPLASGRVFEIGCGGGLNLGLYDPARVTGFAGIDPNVSLLAAAGKRVRERGWDADIRAAQGEDIPFASGSFDTVVCTYTLCSVAEPARVIAELKRVLAPEGRLLFLEHGRAPDANVYAWQRRLEPLYRPLAGNCHLTRPIGTALRAGGFSVEPLGQGYLAGRPRLLSWMEWGVARK